MKKDLRDYTFTELQEIAVSLGEKKFRGEQVFGWIYKSRVESIDAMANLPQEFRDKLKAEYDMAQPAITDKAVSVDGTTKYLFSFTGDAAVECVLIPDEERRTMCISSQAGCACGCVFCATGKLGLNRSLTTGEIIAEFLAVTRESGAVPDSLVFMGMGEPLLNWEAVKKAILILSEPKGLNYSQTRVTVSTVGIVPIIKEITESNLKIYLAVSLICADNEKRGSLIPMNEKYPLADIVAACREYNKKKGEIFIEYIMFDGVNDSIEDARKLVTELKGLKYKVNLIPYNSTDSEGLKAPSREKIVAFQDVIKRENRMAFIRREKGADIAAACGQLAGKQSEVRGPKSEV